MSDLIDQLAAYGRFHEDHQAATSLQRSPDRDGDVIELRREVLGGPISTGVGLMVGAAAAVVLVMGLLFVGGGDRRDPATAAAVPEEIAVVGEFVDALNAGDVEGALGVVPEDWRADFGEVLRTTAPGAAALNAQLRFTAPCEVERSPDGPIVAICQLASTDDFGGPAIGSTRSTMFALVDDGAMTSFSWEALREDVQRDAAFVVAFWHWLRSEHRDVYLSVEPPLNRHYPGSDGDLEEVRVALAHLAEFLAQSETYPLAGVED